MKTLDLKREDIYRGNLILINRDNPIRIEEEVKDDLTPVCNTSHLLNKNATRIIHKILDKIDGNNQIIPVSCFRSKRDQEELYEGSIIENGLDFTQKYVAEPDKSEHQSGLAIDLGENKPDVDFIRPNFPYKGVFNEFRKLARANGFIERYKEDKEFITGISKEPWHFRYVGYPHSAIIEEKGLALEDYHELIRGFTSMDNSLEYRDGKFIWNIFYKELVGDIGYLQINSDWDYNISGNNMDGFIITQYKMY